MVDDFMLDDGIIKNKGHLGADILNNIIKNLSIVDEAIEEACHEINKHDELYEMHFESFENDIQDFNKFRWEYEEFTSYADEYDAMVDSNYKSRMESICEQLSDIRLENITIDNNLGIVDSEGSHYATFEGTRLKHKINIEDVLGVEHVDKAMKAEYEERRQMVQAMQKIVEEDNWPEGISEDTKEAIRQYLSNLNGGKMESYDDEIKNLLTKGEFNFITDKEQNLSLALDFVPLVGDIKGVIEAIKGKEMITNRELSDGEKTMAGISSAVGFIPGVGKAGTLAKAGGKLGAKALIKDAAKYTVKETMKGAGMYGASSIASNLGISPKDQLMAIGGISLYKGGKAVLKNPKVVSAVNNTVDITKATVRDAIGADSGKIVLNSGIGGQGKQLYNSLKKVTKERKTLKDNIIEKVEYGDHYTRVDRKKTLKPNVEYATKEGYTYRTNGEGHISKVCAVLEKGKGKRNKYAQSNVGKGNGRLKSDDGGHLIATIFKGSGNIDNLVPMDSVLNRGDWKSMEKSWSAALSEGRKVEVNIEAVYNGKSARPISFEVEYRINNGEWQEKKFKNIKEKKE